MLFPDKRITTEFRNVHLSFDESQILRDLSFPTR